MKIKNRQKDLDDILVMQPPKHRKPKRPNIFFRTLLKLVSMPELIATRFKCTKVGMERLGKREPCIIFMNHSSFIDLEIAASVLYPRPLNIVATLDAFIGKSWLMRQIGCIPTRKFVFDIGLVRDIDHCIKRLKTSVLMYPEAGYSFDGTATTLPESLAAFVKRLGVPLVMIQTFGAFHRQPLYNELNRRKVNVSAELRYVLSGEQIKQMSVDDIKNVIMREFSFDNFKWQQENRVCIDETFRADGLHRILYRCPNCNSEGQTCGEGMSLRCEACGKQWELTEYGYLKSETGETEFSHIPDWYSWQRECVREELDSDTYGFCEHVDIYVIVNTKGVFKIGDGELSHTKEGFCLKGCDGKLEYKQNSVSLYTLNSDLYWYSIGDVIGIGNNKCLYYCMPTQNKHVVVKARLAAEEIYKDIKKK